MAVPITKNNLILVFSCWAIIAGSLLVAAVMTIPFSDQFGYETRVVDMPIVALFVVLLFLGGLLVLLLPLIRHSLWVFAQITNRQHSKYAVQLLLVVLFATGLLARLMMLFTQPLLEDDYQRYLWDGALTANGYNPYRLSPQDIIDSESIDEELHQLGKQSGLILGRINHPDLRTIYPPVAQFGFAVSYWLKPFSLDAWRTVALACELVSLSLLVNLLKTLNRPVLWSALYWLNPLVIKEVMNAGHMEALLVPLLLGAFWATLHHRRILTGFLLALAVGVKIWPALLLPLFLRADLANPKKLIQPLLLFSGLVCLMAYPVLVAGLDQESGFIAYAQKWKTNSALFPALEALVQKLFSLFLSLENALKAGSLTARFLIASALAAIALYAAWKRPEDGQDLAHKTLLITAAMFLLSPAQMPWYALWFLPFMVLTPITGLALLVPALQVYYLSFYYASNQIEGFYPGLTIGIAWIPVWAALTYHVVKRSARQDSRSHKRARRDRP